MTGIELKVRCKCCGVESEWCECKCDCCGGELGVNSNVDWEDRIDFYKLNDGRAWNYRSEGLGWEHEGNWNRINSVDNALEDKRRLNGGRW